MKTFFTKPASVLIIIATLACNNGFSQADSSKANVYEGLSLQDLLNVRVISASKKSEMLFEAPLSASVISKDDIRKAGCTSIMEAMRLLPGIIVREQSNGNYDIHLRGINIPPNSAFEGNSTATLLVMIDNRPVYSYLKGGTMWETLPVDINDVEKIEVVRGPAAALYGPNAVNGVINIFTRHTRKEGLYLVANTQQGSFNSFINNASIGFQSKKWSTIVSGNYQRRGRSQTTYFEYNRDSLMEFPEYFVTFFGDTNTTSTLYPKPKLAMEKYAGNVFINYNPAEKIKFNLSAGIQHDIGQRVATENTSTPLSTTLSDSRYIDVRANINELSAQVSYNEGTQISEYYPGNKYDFSTLEANVEYNYTKNNFSLKPGVGYRYAVYDDTKYSDIVNRTGLFNTRGQAITYSASLRAEQKLLNNKLRLVAGIAANKFNFPDTTYLSYQFAATYKLGRKHLVRAVYSRALRSPTVYDTYIDQSILSFQTGDKKFTELVVQGNVNLKQLIANMFEIGYRGSINSRIYVDVELFSMHSKNYSSFVSNRQYIKIVDTDTIEVNPIIPTNIPLTMQQLGITVSITWNSKKLQLKPFVTIQQSTVKNYAPFLSMPDAGIGIMQNDDPAQYNIYSRMGAKETLKKAPSVFGGATVNYIPCSKLNINLAGYYYSAQTHDHISKLLFDDGIRGTDNIPAKLILNANISYEVISRLRFFCSGKNILNNRSREFYRTDNIPFMMYGGMNYEF
jgi:iron complex outermembrane receptor protein